MKKAWMYAGMVLIVAGVACATFFVPGQSNQELMLFPYDPNAGGYKYVGQVKFPLGEHVIFRYVGTDPNGTATFEAWAR